jgi:hypothetical protein
VARRTPPIPVQVIGPLFPDIALMQARLIDFDTGSGELEDQHRTWLRNSTNRAKTNSSFHIRVYGYASHLGTARVNEHVSQARMNSVLNFMQAMDARCLSSIELWTRFSDRNSSGDNDDDSPEWRAAEVHIFIGDMLPPPPPGLTRPWRPRVLPLPGGTRYKEWEIAAPGGVVVTPFIVGPSGGFNMFVVKSPTGEMRGYIVPAAGVGASPSIPNVKGIVSIAQSVITGPSYSSMSFQHLTASHAVTWDEIESCLVTVTGAGIGLVRGISTGHIKFECPSVYQYDSSSQPNHFPETIFEFDSGGKDWQLGASATAVGGPLIKIG